VRHDFQQRLESIEELLKTLDSASDPSLRAIAGDLIRAVMDLHGAGLERILEVARTAGRPGLDLVENLAGDELVSSLLVLYDLHPVDLETRVTRAIQKLHTRSGEAKLLSMEEGVARVSVSKLDHSAVEQAILNAAPDLAGIVIEDRQSFVPIEMLLSASVAGEA